MAVCQQLDVPRMGCVSAGFEVHGGVLATYAALGQEQWRMALNDRKDENRNLAMPFCRSRRLERDQPVVKRNREAVK